MAIEKIKILGAVLELPWVQATYLKIGPNWPNRQCCLAGSSKTAPRILIFSIAKGGDNSFYVKSIATYLCPHIFLVYYFILSHSVQSLMKNKNADLWN